MQVTVHQAKTTLSKLLEAVERGEEVIIARGSTPVAKLVPYPPRKVVRGLLRHIAPPPPEFWEPMSEEELRLWEGGEP
jgi:prevent-host-death family protein